MKVHWHGLLPEWLFIPGPVKWFLAHFIPQTVSEALFGIVSSSLNFASVLFSHSEEFCTYKIMQYSFCSAKDVIYDNRFSNIVFTFGVDYPGTLVSLFPSFAPSLSLLHCSHVPSPSADPEQLSEGPMSLNRPSEEQVLDMGTIDVLHNHKHGIPQYNKFQHRFSLIPTKTLADISNDPVMVKALCVVYGGNVESVDLLLGMLAKSPHMTMFTFSNTQFQVFIHTALWRLMTDRFFTTDYMSAVISAALFKFQCS
ncbi:heme peroxidase-domain-containing protein [Mycena albidolilacea]|uniref:Heme peroxidase-domain-containing protein n=1 Tax=Mycena albidolilacea TaxID=1033008 RepID=A0AAD7EEH0_9AGAR|nr:heme peroxidase-domain-containing protein [Mycena albidolilacea]